MNTKTPADLLETPAELKTPTDEQIDTFEVLLRSAIKQRGVLHSLDAEGYRDHDGYVRAKAEYDNAIAQLNAHRANLFEGDSVAA